MAEKKAFPLRMNVAMMKAIEKWAADEFRSVNGQIEWILHQALAEAGRLKEGADVPKEEPGKEGAVKKESKKR
ncbi:Arc family DNA-binding protein [Puia dinghuensis]|uniref:Arc-like DNA binding domain-containing protein n=1 Tax=Puia dinghuensis TaxID=1792502 RepID=A0A8J2UC76_9BACT|nr:Arc family DNA-binding protein [Puia dinghuensis]GGA95345.1 hypothetical protein GCM10011511_18380 [Puia dinghuensis]